MVMSTRNKPTNEESTGATSLAVQGQGTPRPDQAVSTLQHQSTIMNLISGNLETLSQEGKTIVSTIVKALALSMTEKD